MLREMGFTARSGEAVNPIRSFASTGQLTHASSHTYMSIGNRDTRTFTTDTAKQTTKSLDGKRPQLVENMEKIWS